MMKHGESNSPDSVTEAQSDRAGGVECGGERYKKVSRGRVALFGGIASGGPGGCIQIFA
jgi:hypothetical protein